VETGQAIVLASLLDGLSHLHGTRHEPESRTSLTHEPADAEAAEPAHAEADAAERDIHAAPAEACQLVIVLSERRQGQGPPSPVEPCHHESAAPYTTGLLAGAEQIAGA